MKNVIYFVQRADGNVKIGTTKHINTRFRELQAEHGKLDLLGIIDGTKSREKILHWCLSDSWVENEWFNLSSQIQEIIDNHTSIPARFKNPKPMSKFPIYDTKDDDSLTIKEIIYVMDWSYPTALRFAQSHGKLVSIGGLMPKWFTPAHKIQEAISKKVKRAKGIRERLDIELASYASNGTNS